MKILIGIGKIREGQPNKVIFRLVLLLKLMTIFTVHINLNSRKINNKYAILNIKTRMITSKKVKRVRQTNIMKYKVSAR